jgi:hypothetical protein
LYTITGNQNIIPFVTDQSLIVAATPRRRSLPPPPLNSCNAPSPPTKVSAPAAK